MARDKTRDLRKMNRRNFVKSLAGIGISGATLRYMTKDALAEVTDNPKKEVPRLRSLRHTNHQEIVEEGKPPEVEPVYDTIPRDEWAVTESAFDAERKINRAIRQIDDTGLVLAGVTETTSGQHSKKAIEVRYIEHEIPNGEKVKPNVPAEEISKSLPSKASGTAGKGDNSVTVRDIPVTIEKVTHELQTYYDSDYRPVPGGCSMECEGDNPGTTCTPAYDNDTGEYVIVTAAHAITGVEAGHDVEQPVDTSFDSNYIGVSTSDAYFLDTADTNQTLFDAATVDLEDGLGDVDHKYALADNSGGYAEEIYGTIAWASIKDMENNENYKLTKQGRTTGRKSGHIFWASDTAKVFETTADTKGGDSGGPHFSIDDGLALIAGVHNYGPEDGTYYSGATAMEAVMANDAWGDFNLTV